MTTPLLQDDLSLFAFLASPPQRIGQSSSHCFAFHSFLLRFVLVFSQGLGIKDRAIVVYLQLLILSKLIYWHIFVSYC